MTVSNRSLGRLAALCLVALSASLIGGCGGGGGSSSSPSTPTTGTLTGTASKGPVSRATVTAYAIQNGVKGAGLGSATTNADGNFAITMQPYSGAVMLQVHGGSYTDEATGTHMTMMDADDMTCTVPAVTVTAGATTSGIQVTPLTSMAQSWAQHMSGGMTPGNITMANEHVGTHYLGMGADIVMTHPIDPTVNGSANGASEFAKNYGMMLGAMSQEAHGLGMMTSSSGMIRAMVQDASDGVMDGALDGTPVTMSGMGGMMGGGNMMHTAGTSNLAAAMMDFVGNPMNHSGVTSTSEMQSVIDRLNQLAANGGHL